MFAPPPPQPTLVFNKQYDGNDLRRPIQRMSCEMHLHWAARSITLETLRKREPVPLKVMLIGLTLIHLVIRQAYIMAFVIFPTDIQQ